MLEALQQVFSEITKLPEAEQQWLADFLREEIAAERRWADLLSRPSAALDQLINKALAEDEAGLTTPLDPDTL